MASGSFTEALEQAEDLLWLSFQRTKSFQNSTLKGTGREDAVAEFLETHLPDRFGVGRGEAFDAREGQSGQLDLVIYDRMNVRPLPVSDESSLMPAEALLAIVEVKSTLTRDEVRRCLLGAQKVSDLRPYKDREFVVARAGGVSASDGNPRCLYTIFAFESDLSSDGWLQKEALRLREVATEAGVPVERIDRAVVLDRGMLLPADGRGYSQTGEAKVLLREWFLHLTNFLVREAPRRDSFQWQQYVSKKRRMRFEHLEGYSSPSTAPSEDASGPPVPRKRRGRLRPGRRRH